MFARPFFLTLKIVCNMATKKRYKTAYTGKGTKRKRAKKTRYTYATTKKGAARKFGVSESNVRSAKRK